MDRAVNENDINIPFQQVVLNQPKVYQEATNLENLFIRKIFLICVDN